jgi:UDP-glucuronate 4-epimerase
MLPIQPGNVPSTYENIDDLLEQIYCQPSITVNEGLQRFVAWYRGYYKT